MINTKSVNWSRVSEESKREQWRVYHVFNTFNADFFNNSFNSTENIVEVTTDRGFVWVYTWEDATKAPKSAVDGVLEFPAFTNDLYSQDWYSMDVQYGEEDGSYIENGELIEPNSDSN